MDIEGLKKLNLEEMRLWLNDAPRKESLIYLIKVIESL